MRLRILLVCCAALALTVGVATATGGDGNTANAKKCQKGGWQNWVRADKTAFANQDECVSYGAKGGTLIPKVDISLAFNKSSQSAGTLAVHNAGIIPVTVTVEAAFVWSSLGASGEVTADSAQCNYTHDSAGDTVHASCSATVGAGATINFLDVDVTGGASVQGFASVTSVTPTSADPDTSNNTANFMLNS